MDAFGGFDEGNDEFVLQNPAGSQPTAESTGDVQFPVQQQQFAPSMSSGFAQPSEDDDLTEEEK